MNQRVIDKVEQIARMDIRGIKHTRIAEIINMSYGGLSRLLATPEYKLTKQRLMDQQLGRMDAHLETVADTVGLQLEETVPDAVQVIIDAVKVKRDLRAALEVLDRDPKCRLTKHTRQSERAPAVDIPSEMLKSAAREADSVRSNLPASRPSFDPDKSYIEVPLPKEALA